MTPYWLSCSQYHFSIWLLNCNAYSDISSVCQTRWQLATVASHVACSIQDAAIWLVEVPLAANSRKGEWQGRLTWDERDVIRYDVRLTLWLWTVTSPMTLTLDFQGQILKKSYIRNGMPDWHGVREMWVGWMLDPCYDFELWPLPRPRPWFFNIKFWNCCIPGMAGPIDMERKGYGLIGCYTYFVTLSYDLDHGFSRSNFKNAASQEW